MNTAANGIFISASSSLYDMDELYHALFGSFLRDQIAMNGNDVSDMNYAIVRDFTFLCIMACGNDYLPGIFE